jgi:hypothetical protein
MAYFRSLLVICNNDHYIQKGMNIIIEHILSDVVYSVLFYIYGYLLMAWYSMYDEISFTITNPVL